MKAKTKDKLQTAYNWCKENDKSLEFTYAYLVDLMDDNDFAVINFLEDNTNYYQQAYKNLNN